MRDGGRQPSPHCPLVLASGTLPEAFTTLVFGQWHFARGFHRAGFGQWHFARGLHRAGFGQWHFARGLHHAGFRPVALCPRLSPPLRGGFAAVWSLRTGSGADLQPFGVFAPVPGRICSRLELSHRFRGGFAAVWSFRTGSGADSQPFGAFASVPERALSSSSQKSAGCPATAARATLGKRSRNSRSMSLRMKS